VAGVSARRGAVSVILSLNLNCASGIAVQRGAKFGGAQLGQSKGAERGLAGAISPNVASASI
jgi:hypothetical protein